MNRLADEVSPYLLQHKDNPVDWYPWGDEAFEKARRLDRPIFLSIGYATCHWCHVMAHESFEDATVGRLLNDVFVCVKVDREERPDVDHVYMSACQAARGRCGWPLTVLLTPQAEPFFVATYLPRESRHGVMGMTDMVPRVGDLWQSDRQNIERSAGELARAVAAIQTGSRDSREPVDVAESVEHALMASIDHTHGGFGGAPKFPASQNLLLLLERSNRHPKEKADVLVHAVALTVDAIRNSGTFDQVGGGIHRYSTDREWRLPHFEKMLYDQALFVMACAELSVHRGARYARIAEEVADYVLTDLCSPQGAFYCAEDADSEGEEGRFYTWTVDELRRTLPDDVYSVLEHRFGITRDGNFLDEATGSRNGRNVLHPTGSIEDVAAAVGLDIEVAAGKITDGLRLLNDARSKRVRPALDDKVLTDWNGLMIAALSRLSAVTGDTRFVDHARRAATWINEVMFEKGGALLHRYRDGNAGVSGLLNDYSFFLWGLLELFEAAQESKWLVQAVSVANELLDRFDDPAGGGFFMADKETSDTVVRPRELTDGAMPSGNSVAAIALGRLFAYTGDVTYRDAAEAAVNGAASGVRAYPISFGGLGLASDLLAGPTAEVVVVDETEESDAASEMIAQARRTGTRRTVVMRSSPESAKALAGVAPFTSAMTAIGGKPTAYVCQGGVCELPVTDNQEFTQQLATLTRYQG